jgi:hypothetical protein
MYSDMLKIMSTAPNLGEGLGLDSLGDMALYEDLAATMPTMFDHQNSK